MNDPIADRLPLAGSELARLRPDVSAEEVAAAESLGSSTEHTVDPVLRSPPPGRAALDGSLVRGIAWTGGAKWATQGLRWVSTLVIARALTPGDYGIVGMAMVYLGLVQLVNEFGLSSAIIQQRDLTREQIARLGGLSVLIGIGFFLLSAIVSVPIAAFFKEPAVRLVVIVMSGKFIIDSVNAVPRAILTRDLRFRELAWIETLEGATLAIATLVAALLGYRYWALVIGVIASALAAALMLTTRAPHPMVLPRTLRGLRRSVTFGRDLVISRVAWYGYSNADFAIVGRVLDKASLGAYTFAWDLASIPVEKVSAMVGRVTPAIFAAVQHDKREMRRYLLLLTEGIAFATIPMSVGMFLCADDFVAVALGPKWSAAALPMRLLSLYGAFRSLTTLLPQIMVASGRTDVARRYSLRTLLVLPLCFLIGSRWGTGGVAAGWIVGFPLCVLPQDFRFTFGLLGLRPTDYVRAIAAPLVGSAAMAAVVLLVQHFMRDVATPMPRFAVTVGAGALTYGAVVLLGYRARLDAFRAALRARPADQPSA